MYINIGAYSNKSKQVFKIHKTYQSNVSSVRKNCNKHPQGHVIYKFKQRQTDIPILLHATDALHTILSSYLRFEKLQFLVANKTTIKIYDICFKVKLGE